jgi:hypothetical protein
MHPFSVPFVPGAAGTMLIVGHSMAANHTYPNSIGGATLYTTHVDQRGYFNQFQALYNYPFQYDTVFRGHASGTLYGGQNKGVSGDETKDVLTRIWHDGYRQAPDNLLLDIGTNDIKINRSVNQILDGMDQIIEEGFSAGIKRITQLTVFPRNNSTGVAFTTAQEDVRLAVNQGIIDRRRRMPGVFFPINCEFLIDPATGLLRLDSSYDGLHINQIGATLVAEKGIAEQFWNIISDGQKLKRHIVEAYDATLVPYGNLLSNADFSGAAGTASTGASGTVATGFTLSRAAGSNATVVASIVELPDYNGNLAAYQKLEITSPGGGDDTDIIRFALSATMTANIAIGDLLEAEYDLIVDTTSLGSNIIRAISQEPRDSGTNGDASRMFSARFTAGAVKSYWPDDRQRRYIIRNTPVRLQTVTGVIYRWNIDVDTTLAGTRTVYIALPHLRKIAYRREERVGRSRKRYIIGQARQFSLPPGARLAGISYRNNTANAVTGGLKIGSTAGGTDVVAAHAVAGSAVGHIPEASLLKRFFSFTSRQILYLDAVTAWNSASLDVLVEYDE